MRKKRSSGWRGGVQKPAGKVFVLDTWAVLAYLQAEPAAQEVRQVLRRARRGEVSILFSIINFGECLYVIERRHGVHRALSDANTIDQQTFPEVDDGRPGIQSR